MRSNRLDFVFCGGWHYHLRRAAVPDHRLDRGGSEMKKTRKQLDRQREQVIFIAVVTVWIVAVAGVIVWKAVTSG